MTTANDPLGTTAVARACGVSARTACHWIDRGVLPGYRIPHTRTRRVYRDDLVRFLRDHGMRVPDWLTDGASAAK